MSMPSEDADLRPGETTLSLPTRTDAGLFFIGVIRTPWAARGDCPKRGDPDGPPCQIEVDARWGDALAGIEQHEALQVLYWMHLARRDLAHQRPRGSSRAHGSFALRSPLRPNPIASATVRLVECRGCLLLVRGLDCVDGTPLVDLKPDRCPLWPARLAGQAGPPSV